MVRADLVREKVRRLRETADLLARSLPDQPGALAGDRDLLDLVSFRVYLVVQVAVDVASHLIADEGWGPAPSLRDHFTILVTRGVVESATGLSLADGVKVRNLIGHAYAGVDPAQLLEAARELLPVAESFAASVLRYAAAAEGPATEQ